MNILILGSGGREHTLAWKVSQSKLCDNLYIAPGNAGTAGCGANVNINVNDFDAIGKFVAENDIEMVVVGPEDPLVKGVVNHFNANDQLRNVIMIGPSAEGATLEGSKEFSKEFMQRHDIPTAAYKSFSSENINDAPEFLGSMNAPYVLKADGLAAGKGVLIIDDLATAKEELSSMIVDNKFGTAGNRVVIEEFLDGIELSMFVLTDGRNYLILPEAKDYKRIGENDTGLNTGGMGAVSPVPFADDAFRTKVEDRVIRPTIEGLKKESIDYIGFIFFGLMNVNGDPYVIEYNVRMGDPETEVVIPRIKNDLVELFIATSEGTLDQHSIETDPRTAATVMLVSGGYPGSYDKGKEISGLNTGGDSILFHAGTSLSDNKVLTSGGRVIAITSLGTDITQAVDRSMLLAEQITFDKKYYRKDIGADLMALG